MSFIGIPSWLWLKFDSLCYSHAKMATFTVSPYLERITSQKCDDVGDGSLRNESTNSL